MALYLQNWLKLPNCYPLGNILDGRLAHWIVFKYEETLELLAVIWLSMRYLINKCGRKKDVVCWRCVVGAFHVYVGLSIFLNGSLFLDVLVLIGTL